jgi:hypothetical protein
MAAQPTGGTVQTPSAPSTVPPSDTVQVIDLTGAPASQAVVAPSDGVIAPDSTLAVVAGYLNVGVGLIVLAALGMYVAGFGTWITHLKVTGRDQGIEWMESAVRTLFYLIIVLGLVRFAQYHTQAFMGVIAVAVVIFGGWAVIGIIKASGGEEDEH